MGSFLLLAGLLSAQAQETCPDPILLAREARRAFVAADPDAGRALLEQAREALSCDGVPSPVQLAEYWMSDGAQRFFIGEDQQSGILAVQAAGRVAPEAWDPMLGPQLETFFRQGATPETTGTLRLDVALPRGYRFFLDGERADTDATQSSGYHHAAIASQRGEVYQDWLFVLVPETTRTLQVDPLPRQRARGALVTAGASAVAAGGFAVAGLQLSSRFAELAGTEGIDALDQAYRRHVAYGVTSYTLMAVSATGLTLYLVL